jgi:bifunctional non-homologous end joining protein LigD
MRLQDHPTISTPLSWDEVSDVTDPDELFFLASEVPDRVEEFGDFFEDALTIEQELPQL